jgi:ribosomal protein S18 acetylase RimI-like enzyme
MGKPRYTITLEQQPKAEDKQFVWDGLEAFNLRATGQPQDYQELVLLVRANDGAIMGGLLGGTYWQWLHISILWVDDRLRGQRYGSDMLAEAEAEAVRRGCHSAFVDTMSWQALPFYQKHGYEIYGQLDDFPPGHTRYYLKKKLV